MSEDLGHGDDCHRCHPDITWTSATPMQEGWYWYKELPDPNIIVLVHFDGVWFRTVGFVYNFHAEFLKCNAGPGWWAGPLQPPA